MALKDFFGAVIGSHTPSPDPNLTVTTGIGVNPSQLASGDGPDHSHGYAKHYNYAPNITPYQRIEPLTSQDRMVNMFSHIVEILRKYSALDGFQLARMEVSNGWRIYWEAADGRIENIVLLSAFDHDPAEWLRVSEVRVKLSRA